MKIILVQDEIENAIRQYISGAIQVTEGQNLEIDLTAGRGTTGFTATIDITTTDVQAPLKTVEQTEKKEEEEEKEKEGEDSSDGNLKDKPLFP